MLALLLCSNWRFNTRNVCFFIFSKVTLCPASVSWPKFPLTVVDDGEIWNIPVRKGTQTGEQDVCLRKQRERCTIKHRRTPGVTGRTIPHSFFKGKKFFTRGFMALVQPDFLFLVCRTSEFFGADTASVLEIILESLASLEVLGVVGWQGVSAAKEIAREKCCTLWSKFCQVPRLKI